MKNKKIQHIIMVLEWDSVVNAKIFGKEFNFLLSKYNVLNDALILRTDQPRHTLSVAEKRAKWSNVLLNFIIDIGKNKGFSVYPNQVYYSEDHRGQGHNSYYDKPKKADDCGEYLVDVCWSPAFLGKEKWWETLKKYPDPQLELVCESEWGWLEGNDEEHHHNLVVNDFIKILDVRAKLKLFFTQDIFTEQSCKIQHILLDVWNNWKTKTSDSGVMILMVWDYRSSWANREDYLLFEL